MSPYSTSGHEGPHHAGLACPLRSAHRVWPPSRRFTPLGALPVLFRTGGAPGLHPSEPNLARGTRTLPPGSTHLPFPPSDETGAETPARLTGPQFLGVGPLASSCLLDTGLACRRQRSSPGFFPSRAYRRRPGPGFRRDSSHALGDSMDEVHTACASEYRSTAVWPDPSDDASADHGSSSPSRVCAPLWSRAFEHAPVPGYGFTSRRPGITAPSRRSLEPTCALPQLIGIDHGAEHLRQIGRADV